MNKSTLALIFIFAFITNIVSGQTSTIPKKAWSKTSINAVVFRKNSVVTYNNHQYVAFYDAQSNLVLAKRELKSNSWEIKTTSYKGNTSDAHNSISIMVDGEGYLHVAWDHHGHPLKYAKSLEANGLELGPTQSMIGSNETNVTYPEFHKFPNGDMFFLYRDGSSGRGNLVINKYDTSEKTWTRISNNLISGENARSAYWQAAVGNDGSFQISWVWRETYDVETNHDMAYAKTEDYGATWTKSDGSQYVIPITAATSEYVSTIPQNTNLINQTSMYVDDFGNPYIATYFSKAPSTIPQYFLIYKNQNTWKTTQMSQRQSEFSLGGGGTKKIPISRPQIVVRNNPKMTQAMLIYRDVDFENKAVLTKNAGADFTNWQTEEITSTSLMEWEPSYDTELWKNGKILHLYIQKVEQVDSEGQGTLEPQDVIIQEVANYTADFDYDEPAYCTTGNDPIPIISGVSGGEFSSTPEGLSLDLQTGKIDLSASNPGTYTIVYSLESDLTTDSSSSITVTIATGEVTAPNAPDGLTAIAETGRISLEWTVSTSEDVSGYNVYRATAIEGDYQEIATGIKWNYFTDDSVGSGQEYFYKIAAIDYCQNSSLLSNAVAVESIEIAGDLILHLKFENNLIDSSVYRNDAAASGNLSFAEGHIDERAVFLNGSNSFLKLPANIIQEDDITVSTWLKWNGGSTWQRIFDFGNSTSQYIFLTPKSNSNQIRLAIKNNGSEQFLHAPMPTVGQWTHIAITMSETEVALYVNGELAEASQNITIRPSHFNPIFNYIAKSQYPDPLLNGQLDDFMIYKRALSATEVKQLSDVTFLSTENSSFLTKAKLKVWPLPADDKLFLQFPENSATGRVTYAIYELNGRIIKRETLDASTTGYVDVSHFSAGLYLLKIQQLDRIYFKKILIKH